MPKIFSPFQGQDPLGAALAQFGKKMFGGDTSASALDQEKLYDAQRSNTEMDNLMARAAKGGVQSLGSDPIAQAMLLASGYDPSKFGQIGLMGAATGTGKDSPLTQNWQVGTGQSYDNTADAVRAKAAETARNNDMASADRRFGVTTGANTDLYKFGHVGADQAVDNTEANRHNTATEAQTANEFFAKPLPVLQADGSMGFGRQGELAGSTMSPIVSATEQVGTKLGQNWDNLPALNPQQQEVLGARVGGDKAGTPKNYILNGKTFITYDGTTDAQSGQPLPPGGYVGTVQGDAAGTGVTNAVNTGIQQGILANNKLSNLLGAVRAVASKDPTNFGLPGFVKGVAQDARQIAQGLAQGLGYQAPEQMLTEAMQSAAQSGIDMNMISGVFDPDLSSLYTLSDLLVYSAAEALAGQSGRSVSDRDVQFFKTIVGDPQEWMMSQDKYLAKLSQVERILKMGQKTLGDAQQNGVTPAPGTLPGAAPPPAAQAAPAAAPPVVEKWGRGPDGRPVRVQ